MIGAVALVVMLACFGWLTFENAASKTFTLAAAALMSAVLVFGIQAIFELQPSSTKTFVPIEYTLDRGKPEIRQWAYSMNAAWRLQFEVGASATYFAAHPGPFEFRDDLSNVRKLMKDLAIFSTIAYIGNEQFDWQIKKVQYKGRTSGTLTLTAPTSNPSECTDVSAEIIQKSCLMRAIGLQAIRHS
jgi:hypothetical protein